MRELDIHHIPTVARRIARDKLAGRISALETELAEKHADCAALLKQLNSAQEQIESLRRAQTERAEELKAKLACMSAQPGKANLSAAQSPIATSVIARSTQEIATCRGLADKCVFVVGFARSNTTITLQILNCAANALILGEAKFFSDGHGDRFSTWYNKLHRDFQNQVTKSSYAPDFLPDRPHTWWQWLDSAAEFYDCIGEKIALSHYHLCKTPPDAFRAFYEARFLTSRYIFMLRNPIDVLLSSAKLKSIVDDAGMATLCVAWLDFMQLWADFIRVFPRTITIVGERFGEATVGEIEAFTGLNVGDARLLINPANKRQHKLAAEFPTLVRLKPELEELYAYAVAAADESRALWQAEQKRNAAANETKGNALGSVAMTGRPLGRVWLQVQELRKVLEQSRKKVCP